MMRNITSFVKRCVILHPPPRVLASVSSSSSRMMAQGAQFTEHDKHSKKRQLICAAVAGVGVASLYLLYFRDEKEWRASALAATVKEIGTYRADLPTFTVEEVAEHTDSSKGIWVTYGQGVYDITNFVEKHPGGNVITMAAGGALEPFWLLYAVHKQPVVFSILESCRIGNVEQQVGTDATANMEDPYANEPRRHPVLKPASMKPYNAEPPLTLLADSFVTPSELFYVRNHLPVPEVDEATYRLEVEGPDRCLSLSLQDLRTKFPKYTITATVQCAGNRRSEMSEEKEVKGLSWGPAAIGNATWSGARLYDVLVAAGMTPDAPGIEHIQFEGLDTDAANVPYGASIPIEKAMDPRSDILLAYEMNSEPIPKDHGFPVRAVVPGTVGARNVKWLARIVVSREESESHWQRNDYKGFSPSVDWDTVDFSKAPAIQELPVTSAICSPLHGEKVHLTHDGKLPLKGYAWSGGGQKIVRVDITADKGKTWHVAEFTHQDSAKAPRHWAWTLWKAEIPVPPKSREVEVWVKAVDSSYNTQPESFKNIWNLRGVLSNAYHRVRVTVTAL